MPQAEIWLKLERLSELVSETALEASQALEQSALALDDKFSRAMDLVSQRLTSQEQLAQRLREGLCEVQNVPTRRARWLKGVSMGCDRCFVSLEANFWYF